jgi:hypothetical protein
VKKGQRKSSFVVVIEAILGHNAVKFAAPGAYRGNFARAHCATAAIGHSINITGISRQMLAK